MCIRDRECSRLRAELARRDAALESLYLDKCSGLLEESQFLALNRRLRQESSRLQERLQALESAPDAAAVRAALQARLREAAALPVLDRALVSLTIRQILVYPPDGGARPIEIRWDF